MKIKETITSKDIDSLYDIVIFTFIAEFIMVALAMVVGVL